MGTGNYNLQSCFKFGALLGLFVVLGINMVMLDTEELLDTRGSLLDKLWNVVNFGVAGCLNSWVFQNKVEFEV